MFFYQLGESIGLDRLAKVGFDYGFGQKTGLGTNPEAAGRMPTRAWYSQHYKGQFRVGFTLNAAIGQGAHPPSPPFSSHSRMPRSPTAAPSTSRNSSAQWRPADGTVVQDFSPRVRRRINERPEDVAFVNKALWGVVNEEKGTAYNHRAPDVEASGKTGTAQVGHQAVSTGSDETKVWYFNRDHAWFAAFAPSRAPEIAVVVLIEHGGFGGRHAAPVTFQVMQDYFKMKAEQAAKKRSPDPNASTPPAVVEP